MRFANKIDDNRSPVQLAVQRRQSDRFVIDRASDFPVNHGAMEFDRRAYCWFILDTASSDRCD